MIIADMPRVARIVVPGMVHHVTQRGNNRQDVFFVDDDRNAYLRILAQQAKRFDVTVLGYCLMTNHVHLAVIPRSGDALAKAIGRTHWLYSQHINRLHRRSGHLWQNRFHSAAVDDEQAPILLRYVEVNPLRARICRVANRYAWSSAAAHSAGSIDELLDAAAWKRLCGEMDWGDWLRCGVDEAELHAIRSSTRTGRVLASDSRLAKLERRLGRRLRAMPVGRPKKKSTTTRRKQEKNGRK